MPKNPRNSPSWVGLIPTIAVVSLTALAQSFGLGDVLDRRIQDTFIRIAPNNTPEPTRLLPDVAVVTIDPRSLRASKAWPWPRSVHAQAVDRLEAAGVRGIAFDIDFSAPTTPAEDERFASALRASGRVVLATFSQTQSLDGGAELEIVNRPIASLAVAAAALGSVLVPIDSDGIVRNAPRASPIGGEPVPSLARAALQTAAPESLRSRVEHARTESDAILVDFRRYYPRIPVVPYIDLIEGRFDREKLAGRTVFIGATAAEFQDLWATPAEPALPGVMIQAIAYRTAAAEAMGETVLAAAPLPWVLLGYVALGFATLPRSSFGSRSRAVLFIGTASILALLGWCSLWFAGITFPLTLTAGLLVAQYALGIESLQRRVHARAEAQASSLVALSRLGTIGSETNECGERVASSGGGLELALELLGDVVAARGVVLIRALPKGVLTPERIEWRPSGTSERPLQIEDDLAAKALDDRRVIESDDVRIPGARVVYSPLSAGSDAIGVLAVFCQPGQRVDSIRQRTIATVGAQLALTAQNLQLIDRLRETFESSIAAVAGAVEARDGYTDQHCRRLAAFSSLMGARLGMPADEIRAMELGALLHDVGKIGIPDAILNKPGHLSNEERREMERHPEIGAGIVAPVVGLEETTLHCVIHHHERWDGAGYPEGLEGEEIPLAARIVSIVDVWDALSTRRPYKRAFSQEEVRDLLVKGRGHQFDPDLVDLFFEVLEDQGDEMLALIARSTTQGVTEE